MLTSRRSFNKMLGATVAGTAVLGSRRFATAADPFKAGFVYVGPVADFGWTYQHDAGRKAVDAALGDKVKTSYVESVKEGPDAERVIHELAQTGHGIIFTTSFGFMNPTLKVAKQFPKVKFEHCTGYKQADNCATYNIRFYESRYVQGVIAGKLSKSGVVGYIGSVPIPEVVMGMNAVMQGLRSVNPNGKIKIIWVNGWYDPGKEGDSAKALIDQGCDIICQHTDSAAPLQVAEQRGMHGFGEASDMIKLAPKAQLSSLVDNWRDYHVKRVTAAHPLSLLRRITSPEKLSSRSRNRCGKNSILNIMNKIFVTSLLALALAGFSAVAGNLMVHVSGWDNDLWQITNWYRET